MRWIPALALTAFAALALPATAQVHKCKDASGKTIYADAPCAAGQSGSLLERKRTPGEIEQERMQAAEANERKYRAEAARQDAASFEQHQRPAVPAGSQAAAQDRSASPECKQASKELEFVSSIRTLSQDEMRLRTNAAIARVNASCGSNTELMQEPSKVIARPANSGRTCHRAGSAWNCH
ncbi:hypothetical protein D3C78_1101930 [compost metagenome]